MINAELLNQIGDIMQQNQDLIVGVFMIAVLLFLLPTFFVIAVNALGFTAGGVVYGSIAALIESVVYVNGAQAAGIFSILQAIGATATISPVITIIGVTILSVGGGYFCFQFIRSLWQQVDTFFT